MRASSRILLLFPGQGSQSPGMGVHLIGEFAAAREVYEEASEILGWDVAGLCRDGTMEELTRTDRTQLVLLVASVATLRALQTMGLRPAVALGHSLGEYPALVATGWLTFADALAVVKRRGEAMQACAEHHPGAMAAVLGLEDHEVEEICDTVGDVWPANYNSPGQLVISGSEAGVAEASRLAGELGAKRVVRLAVSGAFHTRYMQEAAEAVAEALERVAIGDSGQGIDAACGGAGLFFSTTDLRYPAPNEIKDMLSRQVVSPVRFRQAVEAVAPSVGEAVEVGPGEVLRGLVKRIVRDLPVAVTADASEIGSVRDRLASMALVETNEGSCE